MPAAGADAKNGRRRPASHQKDRNICCFANGAERSVFVLGQQYTVAQALSKVAGGVTLVNSIVSTICAVALYLALRPALERANLLPKHKN